MSPTSGVLSARVLVKMGMQQEGRLREEQRVHGAWVDTLIYSILVHEWHKQ